MFLQRCTKQERTPAYSVLPGGFVKNNFNLSSRFRNATEALHLSCPIWSVIQMQPGRQKSSFFLEVESTDEDPVIDTHAKSKFAPPEQRIPGANQGDVPRIGLILSSAEALSLASSLPVLFRRFGCQCEVVVLNALRESERLRKWLREMES